MAIKEKDFLNLGFVNCTIIDAEKFENTTFIFEIRKGHTHLHFWRKVTDDLWTIQDGRPTMQKIYAEAKIESLKELKVFLTLYKKNLLRVDDGGNYV